MTHPTNGPRMGGTSRRPGDNVETPWGVPSAETQILTSQLLRKKTASRKFAVVIVHYHRFQETAHLLEAMSTWDEKPEQILVADNSAPHYDWRFTENSEIPVSVFPLQENPGYGAAVNHLVSHLPPEIPFFLVLTHEVVVAPRCSRLLIDSLNRSTLAAVSAPLLAYKDKPGRVFSLGGTLAINGVAKHRGMGARIEDAVKRIPPEYAVDWADGACLMIQRNVFEALNGFDPNYFLYVEEIDYQYRVHLVGAKVIVAREARAFQSPGNYPLFLKYRNHLRFTKKMAPHMSPWPWMLELIKDSLRWLICKSKSTPWDALQGYKAAHN